MFRIRKLKSLTSVAPFAVALILIGCFDNNNCPTCPSSGDTIQPAPNPTLNNIWPNADSTAWTYQYTFRRWPSGSFTFYTTEDSVPDIPNISEIEDLLRNHPIGDSVTTTDGIYRLQFDDNITTASGATGQNLKETIFMQQNNGDTIATETESRKTFLTRLSIARPDLAQKITQKYKGLPAELSSLSPREYLLGQISKTFEEILRGPMMLHGGAWEKTNNYIGTYGDLDQLLAWKYLESDLDVDHEFTHQLVPGLASNVFLHCKILHTLTVETEIGSFEKAIECAYIIDYGVSKACDVNSPFLGYTTCFDYGEVIYAPTVGPVYCYERCFVTPGDTISYGSGDHTLQLIGRNTIH